MESSFDKTKGRLGFGCMRLPTVNEEIDIPKFSEMVDVFIAAGFNYFDTAHGYHGGRSEGALREALTSRYPREAYVIADKLSTFHFEREEEIRPLFLKQLSALGVDYIDFYLMHSQNTALYEKYTRARAYEIAAELKREGKIRHLGISFHDKASLLDRILTEHPEIELVQIQFNYADYENPAVESRACYEVCRKHGKPIVVMEPVKGGTLAKVPERVENLFRQARSDASVASWAIRFAASCEGVFMVLSGMSNMDQLSDNMGYMEHFEPMSDAEKALLPIAVKIIYEDIAVACTGCGYCVEGCPKGINIPKYFDLYNADKHSENRDFSLQAVYYENLTQTYGKASDCIRCKKCEKSCPQHIHIADALKQVAAAFED